MIDMSCNPSKPRRLAARGVRAASVATFALAMAIGPRGWAQATGDLAAMGPDPMGFSTSNLVR